MHWEHIWAFWGHIGGCVWRCIWGRTEDTFDSTFEGSLKVSRASRVVRLKACWRHVDVEMWIWGVCSYPEVEEQAAGGTGGKWLVLETLVISEGWSTKGKSGNRPYKSASVGCGKKKVPTKRGPACSCSTHPDLRQTMPSPWPQHKCVSAFTLAPRRGIQWRCAEGHKWRCVVPRQCTGWSMRWAQWGERCPMMRCIILHSWMTHKQMSSKRDEGGEYEWTYQAYLERAHLKADVQKEHCIPRWHAGWGPVS